MVYQVRKNVVAKNIPTEVGKLLECVQYLTAAPAQPTPEPVEEGPTGPLSRPGTGVFEEQSKGKYQPSGWKPG